MRRCFESDHLAIGVDHNLCVCAHKEFVFFDNAAILICPHVRISFDYFTHSDKLSVVDVFRRVRTGKFSYSLSMPKISLRSLFRHS